jgi:hypothetical protein
VERANETLQDRLVKELRLCGASTIGAANAVLAGSFLKDFNERFAVPAAKKRDGHRAVMQGMVLEEVLCERDERAVGHDWCVQWRGRLLQIDARHVELDLPRAGRRVMVVEKASGQLLVRYGSGELTWREVSRGPAAPKKAKKPVKNNKPYKPGPNHPFNRRPACGPAAPVGSAAPPRPEQQGPEKRTVLKR